MKYNKLQAKASKQGLSLRKDYLKNLKMESKFEKNFEIIESKLNYME